MFSYGFTSTRLFSLSNSNLYYFKLRENYNKLFQLKDELSKLHKFKEVNLVRNDLLDIGRFLSREKWSGKL
jgi:hypothetical protein